MCSSHFLAFNLVFARRPHRPRVVHMGGTGGSRTACLRPPSHPLSCPATAGARPRQQGWRWQGTLLVVFDFPLLSSPPSLCPTRRPWPVPGGGGRSRHKSGAPRCGSSAPQKGSSAGRDKSDVGRGCQSRVDLGLQPSWSALVVFGVVIVRW
jgi:hypothetical protein